MNAHFTRTLPLALAAAMNPAHAQTPTPNQVATPKAPSAYDPSDDVFYQIMPIAWRRGEIKGEDPSSPQSKFGYGNFQGIIDGLPYLKSLGVTGIWLNPIFPSPAYHGYQHDRADRINPWFGDEADFLRLLREAKAAGIKVYLDLVAYGINCNSEYFREASNNRASLYTPCFAFTQPDNSACEGYKFKTWNGGTVNFANWDLRCPLARSLVIGWSRKWLDPNADGDPSDGIAGYRLDHVWKTYNKGEDGLGYHIDTFWKEWRAALEQVNSNLFTFAEQADWASFGAGLTVTSDGSNAHDATFTKPFEEAARESLRSEKAAPLYKSMDETLAARPNGRTFLAIIGDHDVDRVSSAIGADDAETAGRDRAAAAVLMLQPLPPIIYSGDEIGMLGKVGNFNSDANDIPRREPMRWRSTLRSPEDPHDPTTNYFAQHLGAYQARYTKDHDGRSVEEQEGRAGSLLETYRELARLRHKHPALRRGSYTPIPTTHPAVWCFRRSHAQESLLVAINLGGTVARCECDPGEVTLVDASTGNVVDVSSGKAVCDLPPYSYRIMLIGSHP